MYQGQKILLVDDDPAIQEIYSAVFKEAGFNFIMASNGSDAVHLAQTEKPTLVLLDIMLPDFSGIDVLSKLKENPTTAASVVWMLTNLGNAEIQIKAKGLGANDFLAKAQNTPRQVVDKIKEYFDSVG